MICFRGDGAFLSRGLYLSWLVLEGREGFWEVEKEKDVVGRGCSVGKGIYIGE